jgi:cell division protein FtsL
MMPPPPAPDIPERRYVYNGAGAAPDHEVATRGNRPVKRRKQSPFNVIAVVAAVSFFIVIYVWNKISVNQLMADTDVLRSQYQSVSAANENLRAEINRKSTLDRIGKIATEQLSMTAAKEQPRMFEVDPEQLERAAEK